MQKLQVNGDFHYEVENYSFDECFTHLRGDTYIYTSWKNIKAPDTLEELFEIPESVKKRKLIQFLREYHLYTEFSWTKYREDVVSEVFNNYSIKTIEDFVQDLESFGIELTPKFERYVSRGYCQGDCIEVFIPHTLATAYGCEVSELLNKGMMKDIDNICWDSQISGTFNISFEYEIVRETFGDKVMMKYDVDFEYYEFSNDAYDFSLNIDSVIRSVNFFTHNSLSIEDLQEIRKSLEAFDYSDVKY